jgi:AcrR family transcriptional regulator
MHHSEPNPSERLVETALALMASRAGGPGLREIAAAAGVSPSLINYRYGSIDTLMAAARVASLEQDARRWETCQRDLLSAPVSRSDLAGLLNELLIGETRPDDQLAALRWLRILGVARGHTGQAGPFSNAEQEFWALLGSKLDLSSGETHTLKAFFHGLAFGHLIGAASPGFHAWSSSLVDLFTRRLLGRPVSWTCADSAWRSMAAQTSEPTGGVRSEHPTRQALLEAAIQIMTEEGVNALTHRRLATEAHASVSSVTHFFNGRREILKDAYTLLYQRLCQRALSQLEYKDEAGSLTPRALAERLTAMDQQGAQNNRTELIGLLNAMFEASRDTETVQLALSLFARSGETSRNLLRCLPGFEDGAGWLDAQIFRLVSNGLVFLSPDEAHGTGTSEGAHMKDRLGDALTLLFSRH